MRDQSKGVKVLGITYNANFNTTLTKCITKSTKGYDDISSMLVEGDDLGLFCSYRIWTAFSHWVHHSVYQSTCILGKTLRPSVQHLKLGWNWLYNRSMTPRTSESEWLKIRSHFYGMKVHPKLKLLSTFTHPHVVTSMSLFLLWTQTEIKLLLNSKENILWILH